MPSKLESFWKKNRGIIVIILRVFFLLLTVVFLVLAILRMIQGDPIYGTVFFISAVVAGTMTFALFRFSSGTLL